MNNFKIDHRSLYDAVIEFIEQSESRSSASTSSAENQFAHISESETWF